MTITYHDAVTQGSDEWYALRLGLLTASEMKLILTPTLKVASNDKERSHLYELLAQRITGFVEPSYVSDDMLRGKEDEFYARENYRREYAPVKEVGFVTNDKWGFKIGYLPDEPETPLPEALARAVADLTAAAQMSTLDALKGVWEALPVEVRKAVGGAARLSEFKAQVEKNARET